jgi:hypothetical protein
VHDFLALTMATGNGVQRAMQFCTREQFDFSIREAAGGYTSVSGVLAAIALALVGIVLVEIRRQSERRAEGKGEPPNAYRVEELTSAVELSPSLLLASFLFLLTASFLFSQIQGDHRCIRADVGAAPATSLFALGAVLAIVGACWTGVALNLQWKAQRVFQKLGLVLSWGVVVEGSYTIMAMGIASAGSTASFPWRHVVTTLVPPLILLTGASWYHFIQKNSRFSVASYEMWLISLLILNYVVSTVLAISIIGASFDRTSGHVWWTVGSSLYALLFGASIAALILFLPRFPTGERTDGGKRVAAPTGVQSNRRDAPGA